MMYQDENTSSAMNGLNAFSWNVGQVKGETPIVMQYTGLKDKNGKEIYEGDIVIIGKSLIEEIKWLDESNWIGEKCPVNGWVNHGSIYKQKPEIIGNIYENPELLR